MVKLGQLLYRQRMRRKVTFEDAAKATKIKASFLAAIERGEYYKLPSPAYAKGFVLNYASFLGISRAEALALFRREFDEKRAYKVLPDSLSQTQTFPRFRVKVKESFFAIGLVILLFLGFLFFQYRSAFFAPALSLSSPKEATIVTQDVLVAGRTDSDATVTVNDQVVTVSNNGEFSKTITFFPGSSVVTVKSKNRFGKEVIVTRNIVVK